MVCFLGEFASRINWSEETVRSSKSQFADFIPHITGAIIANHDIRPSAFLEAMSGSMRLVSSEKPGKDGCLSAENVRVISMNKWVVEGCGRPKGEFMTARTRIYQSSLQEQADPQSHCNDCRVSSFGWVQRLDDRTMPPTSHASGLGQTAKLAAASGGAPPLRILTWPTIVRHVKAHPHRFASPDFKGN
jgi:hypothetical protein